VVWEGRAARRPPIPICGTTQKISAAQQVRQLSYGTADVANQRSSRGKMTIPVLRFTEMLRNSICAGTLR